MGKLCAQTTQIMLLLTRTGLIMYKKLTKFDCFGSGKHMQMLYPCYFKFLGVNIGLCPLYLQADRQKRLILCIVLHQIVDQKFQFGMLFKTNIRL